MMKTLHINITEDQVEQLDQEADRKQISRSELVRRIFDQYFGEGEEKK